VEVDGTSEYGRANKEPVPQEVPRCVDPIVDNNYCCHTLVGNFGQHLYNQRSGMVDIRSDCISPTDAEGFEIRCIAVIRVKSVVSSDLAVSPTGEDVNRWFELEKATCAVEIERVEFDVLSWIRRNTLRGI